MSQWGYIGVGLLCGVIAGICFASAGPDSADMAAAAFSGRQAESNGFLQFLGYVFAAASSVLTLIGIVAQGVRVGQQT